MNGLTKTLGPIGTVHAAGVGAVLLVLLGGWLLVLRPSASEEAARALMIRRLAEAEPRLIELQGAVGEVRAETRETLGRLERSHNRLGGVGLRNERLAGLTELGGECGLRIDRVEPGEFVREGLYLVMPIRMEGVGAYPSCAAFLSLLLERFSDMSVRAFALDAESGGGARLARFGFDLVWYADPAGAAPESLPTPVDE